MLRWLVLPPFFTRLATRSRVGFPAGYDRRRGYFWKPDALASGQLHFDLFRSPAGN